MSLTVDYSIDGGKTWDQATTDGNISGIGSEYYSGSFNWDGEIDLPGYEGTVLFRVTPNNCMAGIPDIEEVDVEYNKPPDIAIEEVTGEKFGNIEFFYTVSDAENDTLSVKLQYSDDAGSNWNDASFIGDVSGIVPGGDSYSIIWQSDDDLPGVDSESIWLMFTAGDNDWGEPVYIDSVHVDNNAAPSVSFSISNPDSMYEDYLDVFYVLEDSEQDTLQIELYFSFDGEDNTPATVYEDILLITKDDYSGSLRWELDDDLPNSYGTAKLKMVPTDNDIGNPDSLIVAINSFGVCAISVTVPENEQTADFTVGYTVTDRKNKHIDLNIEFSTDNGKIWNKATTEGTISDISSEDYKGSFIWNGESDLPEFDGTARLRVTPNNGYNGLPDSSEVILDYNKPPSISVEQVTGEKTGVIPLSFTVSDEESDTIDLVIQYSLDSGNTFKIGTLLETGWDSFAEIGYCYQQDTYIRLTPYDNDPGQAIEIGPFLTTNLVSDFNHDLIINGDDLLNFSNIWNDKDITKEIGPVTGTPPDLTVVSDGKVDSEDFMVFLWMWHWYTKNPIIKKMVYLPAIDEENTSLVYLSQKSGGKVQVICKEKITFLQLFMTSDTDSGNEYTLTGTDYWEENRKGVVLTRNYSDGSIELAAAILDSSNDVSFGPYNVAELSVIHERKNQKNIIIYYKARISGQTEIIKGEASI